MTSLLIRWYRVLSGGGYVIDHATGEQLVDQGERLVAHPDFDRGNVLGQLANPQSADQR
jgi:hypothetical protein